MNKKRERISNKTLIHASKGEFSQGDKNHLPRFLSGGHGQENIQELKKRKISYNIVERYPNGVRLGNVPTHKQKQKRTQTGQTWFPESWTRNTIKKAAEKTINSVPYKLPDGMNMFGTYKKVKVVVKRTNGEPATIFPYYKQSRRKQKWNGK